MAVYLIYRPLRLITLMKVDTTAFICPMTKYVTDPISGLVLEVAGQWAQLTLHEYKKVMTKRRSRAEREHLNLYAKPFPWKSHPDQRFENYLEELKGAPRFGGEVLPQAERSKTPRSPGRSPKEANAVTPRPRRAPGGRSRRPRAVTKSRKGDRYRHGWNNRFSIKPLDAKKRAYYFWPRN